MRRVLTIAGSDSGGGAGIQADLKTFQAFGCFGMSAITAVTAQNTVGVQGIQELSSDFVAQQIASVVTDIGVDAVKTGMLANAELVRSVAQVIKEHRLPHLVVDPVMRAKGGDVLLKADAQDAVLHELLPLAEIVTPNIPEAEILASMPIRSLEEMKQAAKQIYHCGPKYVLVKGGHLVDDATDVLFDGARFTEYSCERIRTKNTHGTGCTLSAAIAANLALGRGIHQAVDIAKKFVTLAIRESLSLGKGAGPLNHFVKFSAH